MVTAQAAELSDGLLPGEDPTTSRLVEAVHWVTVYSELLAIKLALLERIEKMLQGMTDDAIRQADLDRDLLAAQTNECQHRLEFWSRRVREMKQEPA